MHRCQTISGWACLTVTLVMIALWPRSVAAAEVTHVMDAFDGGTVWSGSLSLRYEFMHRRSSIVREWVCEKGDPLCPTQTQVLDTKQLHFSENASVLHLDLRTGLKEDLELYASLPFVLSWQSALNHDTGVSTGNSLVSTGLTSTLFAVPFESARRIGIGDLTAGLKWAPIHAQRESLLPSVVIGAEYLAPTGSARSAGGTGVGGGVHAFTFFTAISQPIGRIVEPYLMFNGTLRVADPTGPFKHLVVTQTRVAPGHSMAFAMGAEFSPWGAPGESGSPLRVDIRAMADFITDGRQFSELFDALGTSECSPADQCNQTLYTRTRFDEDPKRTDGLTDVEQHGRVGGQLSVTYDAHQNLSIRALGAYFFTMSHFITYADAGKDLDGQGNVRWANRLGQNEFNPFYNHSYDDFGKRFRVEGSHDVRFFLTIQGQL